MQHNYGATNGNMSLDGGYIGSIDHAIANLHVGRNQGRNQGLEEGLEEGYAQGHQDGQTIGYTSGWNAASAVANRNMAEQLAFTRQHIVEKERLQAEVVQQRALILQLEQKVRELTEENASLRAESSKPGRTPGADLTELVTALKQANARLQNQVTQMDKDFQVRNKEYADQVWQYNRSLVFMNAVRGVLEDITSDKSPQADQVRALFVDKYKQQLASSLEKGLIKEAPEKDAEFEKALPRTRKFIMNMLNSVGNHKEVNSDDHDLAP